MGICLPGVIFIFLCRLIQILIFFTGSQSESDSLASEEGANDDNTDDELSKVVGGLEFAIDRQDTDTKQDEKKETTESKPQEEKKPAEQDDKKPLHSLQSVSGVDVFSSV